MAGITDKDVCDLVEQPARRHGRRQAGNVEVLLEGRVNRYFTWRELSQPKLGLRGKGSVQEVAIVPMRPSDWTGKNHSAKPHLIALSYSAVATVKVVANI